ncbi:hypothetical protein [Pseudarthrobacter sp. S9]|uniref:hypothetical protein n=1 Tax=Pseudarthrobacter sp. S9 TaxID=3418421 RepID=UPI003D07F849
MSNLHACTRNGKSWEEDPGAVRAMAALLRAIARTTHRRVPMNEISKASVLAILETENLGHYNWFEDRYPHAHEAGVQVVDSG